MSDTHLPGHHADTTDGADPHTSSSPIDATTMKIPASAAVVSQYPRLHPKLFHADALELDLSLLRATLNRNRTSHKRTRYYRRLRMALTCVTVTHSVEGLVQDWEEWRTELKRLVVWAVASSTKTNTNNNNTTSSSVVAQLSQLIDRVSPLIHRLTIGLSDSVSRLEYAGQAAFVEIARGFFLPFLTVTTACAARIRTLLYRLAGHVGYRIQSDMMAHVTRLSTTNTEASQMDDFGIKLATLKNTLMGAIQSVHSFGDGESLSKAATSGNNRASKKIRAAAMRAERTAATLAGLGIIVVRNNNKNKQVAVLKNESSTMPSNTAQDADCTAKLAATDDDLPSDARSATESNVDADVDDTKDHDDDGTDLPNDVGEPVVDWSRHGGSTDPRGPPVDEEDVGAAWDANATMLQQMQQARRAQSKRQREASFKATTAPVETVVDKAGQTSKKKKKKRKGADFFDALFG